MKLIGAATLSCLYVASAAPVESNLSEPVFVSDAKLSNPINFSIDQEWLQNIKSDLENHISARVESISPIVQSRREAATVRLAELEAQAESIISEARTNMAQKKAEIRELLVAYAEEFQVGEKRAELRSYIANLFEQGHAKIGEHLEGLNFDEINLDDINKMSEADLQIPEFNDNELKSEVDSFLSDARMTLEQNVEEQAGKVNEYFSELDTAALANSVQEQSREMLEAYNNQLQASVGELKNIMEDQVEQAFQKVEEWEELLEWGKLHLFSLDFIFVGHFVIWFNF